MREVILLCGPPGAGKTTAARASPLAVFDRDDDHWTSEQQWRAALARLARDRTARAVVIRSGATSLARARAAATIRATHVFLLLAPRDELRRRVRARARADKVGTLVGIDRWLASFDRDDRAPDFPGWAALLAPTDDEPGVTSIEW